MPLLPKWPNTANPFYEFGSRFISVTFISGCTFAVKIFSQKVDSKNIGKSFSQHNHKTKIVFLQL